MTITTSIGATKAKIDWTRPVLWLFAACLVGADLLPISWLAVFSVTDKAVTSRCKFRHAVYRSRLPRSAADRHHPHHFGGDLLCYRRSMGWLVSLLTCAGRQFIRNAENHGLVRDAAVSRRRRQGIAGGNSGLLNQLYRFVTGAVPAASNIYSMTEIIFVISSLHLPVCVRAGCQRARTTCPASSRMLPRSSAAGLQTTARRVTIPLALPPWSPAR
jgi:iron(III) transport system permease protein